MTNETETVDSLETHRAELRFLLRGLLEAGNCGEPTYLWLLHNSQTTYLSKVDKALKTGETAVESIGKAATAMLVAHRTDPVIEGFVTDLCKKANPIGFDQREHTTSARLNGEHLMQTVAGRNNVGNVGDLLVVATIAQLARMHSTRTLSDNVDYRDLQLSIGSAISACFGAGVSVIGDGPKKGLTPGAYKRYARDSCESARGLLDQWISQTTEMITAAADCVAAEHKRDRVLELAAKYRITLDNEDLKAGGIAQAIADFQTHALQSVSVIISSELSPGGESFNDLFLALDTPRPPES